MNFELVEVLLWTIAGIVSFYFSLGNARVWTSISLGFFLVLFAEVIPQAVPVLPGLDNPQVVAMGYIISTISILLMTHGFQEYYVFSKTLDIEGSKMQVYLGTGVVIVGSLVFIMINPAPTEGTLETIHLVGRTNWVFLSLINIDMIRKIYINVQDTPIANVFLAFIAVFIFCFLWKGSELYIDVYNLEQLAEYAGRYKFSILVANMANFLASISVGGTFAYLLTKLK